MIYYFSTAEHTYTMTSFLESWADRLQMQIEVIPYTELIRRKDLKRGVYIFSDIERLSKGQASVLSTIWKQLEAQVPAGLLLNHPARSMGRFELLKYAFEQGINDYDVHWVSDRPYKGKFPLFVREASEHSGNKTPLLYSQAELDAALDKLSKNRSFRRDLMISEFCDVSDDQGVYRKYAAFRVGDAIVPRHVFFSKKWMQKMAGDRLSDTSIEEEQRNYQEENPHAGPLMEIFKAAGIEYGRIDYGLWNGRVQIWEINTNPWVVTTGHMEHENRRVYHEMFLQNILDVLHRVGDIDKEPPVQLSLSPSAVACYEVSKGLRRGMHYSKKRVRVGLRALLKRGC